MTTETAKFTHEGKTYTVDLMDYDNQDDMTKDILGKELDYDIVFDSVEGDLSWYCHDEDGFNWVMWEDILKVNDNYDYEAALGFLECFDSSMFRHFEDSYTCTEEERGEYARSIFGVGLDSAVEMFMDYRWDTFFDDMLMDDFRVCRGYVYRII